jgi:HD-GYP domain-containing protein (c-di-GMP phosphodiesterase class II)
MKTGVCQIINGPFEGQIYRFLHSVSIGRDESNAIQLLDPKVSRNHVKIDYSPEGFRIKDLQSKNGTLINRVKKAEAVLAPGDIISLGSTELVFSQSDVLGDDEETSVINISAEREALHSVSGKSDEFTSTAELRRRFDAVLRVNQAIGHEPELRRAFERILEEIFHIFPAERGAVLAINDQTGKLDTVCCRMRSGPVDPGDIRISQTILNKVMEKSVGILVDDAQLDDQFSLSESVCLQNIRSALSVPFIREREIIGILYLDVSSQSDVFSESDLDLLMAIAGPASVQIQNSLYTTQLRESYWNTIRALANAVDARDPYTVGHNWRVSRLAVTLSSSLGWSREALRRVELGGVLHDIGKIGISDTILLKSSRLDQDEWKVVQSHPEVGARIITGIDFLQPVIPYMLYHHERWDGTGYPCGLKGMEIPKEGRLLAVCDAFDAMSTSRPYRDAMKMDEAVEELLRNKGKQFDSNFVNSFTKMWQSGKVNEVLEECGGGHMWFEGLQTQARDGGAL